QRQEDRIGPVQVVDEEDHVPVQQWAGSRAVGGVEAQVVVGPEELAAHVVAEQAAGAEEDDYPLAVGHRRGRGEAVLVAHPALRGVFGPAAPQEASVGLVEAVDGALPAVRAGRGEEDAVAPDDRRGVAPAGDPYPPEDAGPLAVPADGQRLSARQALAAR